MDKEELRYTINLSSYYYFTMVNRRKIYGTHLPHI